MKEDISFKEVFLNFCEKHSKELNLKSEDKVYLISSANRIYENIMNSSNWRSSLFDIMLLQDLWLSNLMSEKMNKDYRYYFWNKPKGIMLDSEIKECIRFGFEFCDASDYDYYDWDSYWLYEREDCETEEYYWRAYEVKEYKGAIHTPIY